MTKEQREHATEEFRRATGARVVLALFDEGPATADWARETVSNAGKRATLHADLVRAVYSLKRFIEAKR